MRFHSDQTLAEAVRRHLSWTPGVAHTHIAVSASGGVVTLRGTVTNLLEWNVAQETSRSVYGVAAVVNELDVRRGGSQ